MTDKKAHSTARLSSKCATAMPLPMYCQCGPDEDDSMTMCGGLCELNACAGVRFVTDDDDDDEAKSTGNFQMCHNYAAHDIEIWQTGTF